MLIGAHESVSGGLFKAVGRAEDDGCESVQVFVKNNNRWSQRQWRQDEIDKFINTYHASSLQGVMAHTGYLINLCSAKQETIEKSINALADELNRCAQLGIPLLVMHPGSHVGQGEEKGLELIAENLKRVYELEPGGDWADVTLLFENTAGQGTNLGYTMEHLQALFELVEAPERFGVCFDTCHAHASGYDLTTRDKYEAYWQSFDEKIGLERVKGFHLNDSKFDLGSKKDRHEHIGEGYIGTSVFEFLVNDARFANVVASVETPADDEGTYQKDVSLLKGLRQSLSTHRV